MRKTARTVAGAASGGLAQSATSRAPAAASSCAAVDHSALETASDRSPGAPGCSTLSTHQFDAATSTPSDEARRGAIPLGEIRRNVEPEREHQAEVQEHRQKCRCVR